MENIKFEIQKTIERGDRILITTLTKRLAEELTEYLLSHGVKTRYLHSDIDTLERTEIIRELRLGTFDVLVGINLLREGLDIPEVGFIGILDADKEGFLRDARSLIQIIGRAARNSDAFVVLYADTITGSMQKAMDETERRRALQIEYNTSHGITPKTIQKPVRDQEIDLGKKKKVPKSALPNLIINLESQMKSAAQRLDFEEAIRLRDQLTALRKELE